MAAGIRKAGESMGAYRARLNREQAAIDRTARGRVVFLSVERAPYMAWPLTHIARAVRDGKLNHKSGRRLATAYR